MRLIIAIGLIKFHSNSLREVFPEQHVLVANFSYSRHNTREENRPLLPGVTQETEATREQPSPKTGRPKAGLPNKQ